MDATNAGFKPDTSIGILPMPHVLLYYALFFGSGLRYHDCADADHRLGRGWRWTLPATLLLVFPPALEFGTGANPPSVRPCAHHPKKQIPMSQPEYLAEAVSARFPGFGSVGYPNWRTQLNRFASEARSF